MTTDLNLGLALLAGILTVLSPCVLPLVPIVLSAAQSRHRLGPVVLGAGLALSFTIIGLFVATVGFAIGLDADLFRAIGGWIMMALGIVLIVGPLQRWIAGAGAPLMSWADGRMRSLEQGGLIGQAAMGLLLGLVWAPCVGPTLGAASLLAAQGENLGTVALTMLVFGVGAALPLVVIGLLSNSALKRLKGGMGATGRVGKLVLGLFLLVLGALIVLGVDRTLETWLVDISPDWLTRLTTRY